jgi:hypothetical protein
MVTAHSNRADMTKNFVAEQSIYRVEVANTFGDNAVTAQQVGKYPLPKDSLLEVFNGCVGTGEQLKSSVWYSPDWLSQKNDVFQSAYIASSRNLAALKVALHRSKEPFQPVDSFRYACTDAMNWKSSAVIPNAPVVLVSFLNRTDDEVMSPANAKYNWFTGMCLVGANCTDADFVPRNDSIYADLIAPQVTANQGAALKALKATGTPEFWIAAAHANGIYGHDSEFANYAEMQQVQVAKDLHHTITDSEEWMVEASIGLGLLLIVTATLCWLGYRLFAPRVEKVFTKKSETNDVYRLPKFEPKPGRPIWP